MKQRRIGTEKVGEIGLGCMGMSFAYGPADENENLQVLSRAIELGVNFWDTADMYGQGENEHLLAKSLETNRDQVFLATKFGNVFDRTITKHQDQVAQNAPWIVDGSPAYVKQCCENSLQRLKVDHIDLYYQHRVDPLVPIEETVGAMKDLVKAGKIRFIGLSEAGPDTIRRAHSTHPVTALQTEYSLWTRHVEDQILPLCKELGITFVPYSPLGRGFLTGEIKTLDDLASDDWRRLNPRFQGDNLEENQRLVAQVREVAQCKEATPAQVAIAWVLAQGEDVVPIPGTKRLKYLEQNAEASNVMLTKGDLDKLNNIPVATGERYPEVASRYLNG